MPRLVPALVVAAPLVQEDSGVSLGILILLVIIGLALVMAEMFFVSLGILSILAAVALISSVFLAFQKGQFFGFVFLAIAALGAPAAAYFGLKLLPNTPMGKWLLLSAPNRETVTKAAEQPGLHEFLDKTGVALSALRPAGFARIDGQRVDVVTRGELLDKNCPVKVVEVEGNRVVVSRREDGDRPDAQPASIEQPENERG